MSQLSHSKALVKKNLKVFWNLANIITYSRILLVFLIIFLVYTKNLYSRLFALLLLVLIFFMDWLDGFVARKYHLATAFGGVVDVAGDRIVENSLWISFAYLQLIPLWAPLIVISRSFITDGVRSFVLSKGKTTFAMMESWLGRQLVSSRWSRGLYGISKGVVFGLLILDYSLKTQRFMFLVKYNHILPVLDVLVYGLVIFVVALCVVRGVLTIYDSRKYFYQE